MKLKSIFFLITVFTCYFNYQSHAAWVLRHFFRNPEYLRNEWFKAAAKGNLHKIKEFIHDDVDINMQNKVGETALILAAKNRREDVVKFLLDLPGIKKNIQFKEADSILTNVVYNGHENIVKFILQIPGVNVNIRNDSDPCQTPLLEAAWNGRVNIVKLLLESPNININAQDNFSRTALMGACATACYGHEEVVKLLLTAPGIDVNVQNSIGETALFYAILNNKPYLTQLLLADSRTKINLQNNSGKTALMVAMESNKDLYVKFITDKVSELTAKAFEAIKDQDLEALKKIIERIGVDTVVDSEGNTLLDKAFATNNAQIIEYFLQNSEDPRELLAHLPFEFINPTSPVFEYIVDLAYGQSTQQREAKSKEQSADSVPTSPDGLPLTVNPMHSAKSCAVCSTETDQLCAKCKKVYYCSRACQKADWKNHKSVCIAPT